MHLVTYLSEQSNFPEKRADGYNDGNNNVNDVIEDVSNSPVGDPVQPILLHHDQVTLKFILH